MADVQRLGEYRIDREIARSSIASIYEGFQESLDRKVLIKRLHPQLVGDAEIRSRFEREARAIARIKHKNIVHIYDFRAEDDLVLLVSEWISGGTIEELVRREKTISEREAVALCLDVLEGLAVAHEAGIIHRDIKPSNLLIASSGAIKITDFGLAQFEGAPNLTQQGVVMGTPAYMAPELITGAPADARCDLYNLGVTVYELLTGVNPFRSESMSQTLNRVMSVKPEPLEGVHPALSDFLLALLEKRPEKRPQTAREALTKIRPLATSLGVERGWAALEREVVSGDSDSRTRARPVTRPVPSFLLVVLAWLLMVGVTTSVFFLIPATPPEKTTPAVLADSGSTPATTPAEQQVQAEDTTRNAANQERQHTQDRERLTPVPTGEESKSSFAEDLQRLQKKSAPPPLPVSGEQEIGTAPQEDTTPPPKTRESAPEGNGFLYLNVHPWANVYFGDKLLVQTPYNKALELPSGKVDLTLINPEFPPIVETVEISPNDTLHDRVNLFDKVGTVDFIDATPWAEVYLDGDYLGRTPIGRPVFVRPGHHDISFRHPTLTNRIISFEATPGGKPLHFRVDLTEKP